MRQFEFGRDADARLLILGLDALEMGSGGRGADAEATCTQVFALSTHGKLLSFTTHADGQIDDQPWSAFNLSAMSGSGAD